MKAMGMFNDLSFMPARITMGRSDRKVFQAAYEKGFSLVVESLAWGVIAERVQKRKARLEKLNAEFVKA